MRQSRHAVVIAGWIGLVLVAGGAAPGPGVPELVLSPGAAVLHGATARQQLIATGTDPDDGRPVDLTRRATWRSETPEVVAVEPDGVVRARGDGEGTVV